MLLKGPDTLDRRPGRAAPGRRDRGAGARDRRRRRRALGSRRGPARSAASSPRRRSRWLRQRTAPRRPSAAARHGTFSASDLERPARPAARAVTRLHVEVDESAITANARRLLGAARALGALGGRQGRRLRARGRAQRTGGARRRSDPGRRRDARRGPGASRSARACGSDPPARPDRGGACGGGGGSRGLHLDAGRARAAGRGRVPRQGAREGRYRHGPLGAHAAGRALGRPRTRGGRAARAASWRACCRTSPSPTTPIPRTRASRSHGSASSPRSSRRARGISRTRRACCAIPPRTSTRRAAGSRSTVSRPTTATRRSTASGPRSA